MSELKPRGPASYFWNYEFRFDLRDATRREQDAVRRRFKRAGLKLTGFTTRHILIVEDVLGRRAHARQSDVCPKRLRAKAILINVHPLSDRHGVRTQHDLAYVIADSLNAFALIAATGNVVARHWPSSPLFWFYSLAREQAALCRSTKFRKLLTPEARGYLNANPSSWGRANVVLVKGVWRQKAVAA